MSEVVLGKASAEAAVAVQQPFALPIDPATGAVRVVPSPTAAASLVRFQPESEIYASAAAEGFSLIPAAANPASFVYVWAHVVASAAISYFVQIHRGNAQPAIGAVPKMVSEIVVPPGGVYQMTFPVYGVERVTTGWVVLISLTQDTYTTDNLARLLTRAYGQLP